MEKLPLRINAAEILNSLIETVKSGNAEAVRLLYPLAAFLRMRESESGVENAEDVLKRTREHFLVIAESSTFAARLLYGRRVED